ncbi:MAG: glycosyltransferase family 4 protein [Planctomycetota bacterium]
MPPPNDTTATAGGAAAPIAVVCHTVPPYRAHLHRRIAGEEPRLRLITVNTHNDASRNWPIEAGNDIGLVDLTRGDTMMSNRGPFGWLAEWRRGGEIIELLKREGVRAVVMNGYNDAGRRRVIRWCQAAAVPCFLWGDSNLASDRRRTGINQRIKRWLVPRMVRLCTGCFACGSLGKQFWEFYGADPAAVFISPYEPDYRLIWDLTDEEVADAARRHGLAEGRRRLVFSGRLTGVKRVDLLVDAFVALADDRPDWDLLLIGDGELREELLGRVPDRLRPRTRCTGFLSDQQEVSRLYRASDVLVLPSTFEPWALVINEAAAAGMAMVATDVVGAAAELIVNGTNGYVVPADDGDALRKAIARVTDDANTDRMKAASAEVLEDWRRRGDPVEGLREALRFAGVLAAG